MVHEYSKKDEECEDLKKKLTYREEEVNYYQNRACDLALEYNSLLDSYQRVGAKTTYTALIKTVSWSFCIKMFLFIMCSWVTLEISE